MIAGGDAGGERTGGSDEAPAEHLNTKLSASAPLLERLTSSYISSATGSNLLMPTTIAGGSEHSVRATLLINIVTNMSDSAPG